MYICVYVSLNVTPKIHFYKVGAVPKVSCLGLIASFTDSGLKVLMDFC